MVIHSLRFKLLKLSEQMAEKGINHRSVLLRFFITYHAIYSRWHNAVRGVFLHLARVAIKTVVP